MINIRFLLQFRPQFYIFRRLVYGPQVEHRWASVSLTSSIELNITHFLDRSAASLISFDWNYSQVCNNLKKNPASISVYWFRPLNILRTRSIKQLNVLESSDLVFLPFYKSVTLWSVFGRDVVVVCDSQSVLF